MFFCALLFGIFLRNFFFRIVLMDLADDFINMTAVFFGLIDDKDQFRRAADGKALGELGSDKALRSVESLQSGLGTGILSEESAVYLCIAVVVGNFNISDCHKTDICVLDLKLDDIRNILADNAFEALLFDAAHMLLLHRYLLLNIGFNDIADLDVVVILNRDTALVAVENFSCVILEALRRGSDGCRRSLSACRR